MNFEIECQDLQKGLAIVTRALSIRPAQKVLEGVLIQSIDQKVILTCTDSNMTIRASFPAQVHEKGAVVLPGRFFTELTKKLPFNNVSVISNDDKVQIKCLSSNSTLVSLNAFEFPRMQDFISTLSFKISQKKFKEMIMKTSFSMSTDENRPVFTGSLIEIDSNTISIVALDGFRIAVQVLNQKNEMPAGKVVNELSRILQDTDEICTIHLNNKQIKVEFGNTELLSVLLSGDFIDYRKVIPLQFKSHAEINKLSLQDSVERASLLAREGKNNTIRMRFVDNHLRISSHAEMGEVVEDMEVMLNGDPVDIAFNSKYLSEIIQNIQDDHICMNFNSTVSPCVLKDREESNYIYMILPMRT